MKKINFTIALTLFLCVMTSWLLSSESTPQLNLMPMPANVVCTNDKFRIEDSFTITLKKNATTRLANGATRMLRRLSGRTGLFLPQDYITVETQISTANMLVEVKRAGMVVLNENESYDLIVTPAEIFLSAETDIGALRGMETLLQLLDADEQGYFFHTAQIDDQPRFPWRGLLIDVCRHFMPIEVIKRNLDGMAAVKMNVLHWHLTEDQGFRVECKTYPKLHQLGSDGFYYTQEQIREIIEYASDRGIRVVPEFDLPGHSTSWFVGYPELASAPGPYTIERKWGVFDPTFDPTREEVYQFLDNFFKEMVQLFPDEYIHIGGDENNGKQWSANPDIQAFMKEKGIPDNHTLQTYFNSRLLEILTKYNRKMMGWDEILQPNMPKNIMIHSWRHVRWLMHAVRQGYQAILSRGYYIDLIQPAGVHYLNDPVPKDSLLTDAEKERILGGEATMWAEFVGPETVDSRIWPRTAAIAERLWSPQNIMDIPDMYRRLEVTSFRLEELGLTHEKNYDMMLRRLTHNADIEPLKMLVDVIEPVKIYMRNKLRPHTSYSPLTRVVDAARPDAKTAREFRNLIDNYLTGNLKDATKLTTIEIQLHAWKNNHSRLKNNIKIAPILKEIETLSEDLSLISTIGLEALEYLRKGKQPKTRWVEGKLELLAKAKTPRGQTELMIISAIEKMVIKASE